MCVCLAMTTASEFSEVMRVRVQTSEAVKVDVFVFRVLRHLVRRYRSFHPLPDFSSSRHSVSNVRCVTIICCIFRRTDTKEIKQ